MPGVKHLALAVALAVTVSVASAAGETADELVFDAMSAPATISYAGHVEVVRVGTEGSKVFEYSVAHRAPDLSVRVYSAPARLRGDEVVARGKTTYSVDQRRHRIVVSQNAAAQDEIARDDNYLLMRANYHAIRRDDASFDGRDVFVVALINNFTREQTMVVRIDKQTKLALDKIQYGRDGALAGEVRFEDVRFVSTVADSAFTLPANYPHVAGPQFGDPSENVARVIAAAGFAATGPKFLPEGFSPVEGKLESIKGTRTLHLLYSDGIRTVSLFENQSDGVDLERLHPQTTTIDGHTAQYAEDGQTVLLAWTQGDVHCALVGELDLDELQRMAASI